MLRMKIKAHNSSFCGERKLRVRRVLERPAADQSIGLPHEVIGAVADGEEVTVLGVPAHGSDMLAPDAVGVEFPKRQQSAFPFLVRIAGILPIPAN